MSKITRLVRHLAVVAVASLCAQCAWAITAGETYTWTNTGKSYTAGYGGYNIQSISLPPTADLPAGSIVKLKKITLAQDCAFAPDGAPYNYYVIEGLGTAGTSKQASDLVVQGTGNALCGTSGHINIVYNYSTPPEMVVGKGYVGQLRSNAAGTASGQTQRMCVLQTKDAANSAIDTTNGSFDYAAAYVIEAEVVSVATAVTPAKTIAINFNATAKDNNENGGSDAWKLADAEGVSVIDWTIPGSAWLQVVDKANTSGVAVPKQWIPGTGTTDLSGVSVTWRSDNNYMRREASTPYIMGYLDDGGVHAQVTVTGIPYKAYDVTIVSATDTANKKFSPVTVNGVKYTYKNGTVESTTNDADTWGASQKYIAEYGVNAIKVTKQSGTLSIVGGGNANGARGGIAAVIITEASADVIDADDVATVSAANDLGQADIVNIHLAADAVFTIDAAPTRAYNLIATGAVTVKVAEAYTPTSDDFAKINLNEAPQAILEIATADIATAAAAVNPAKKYLYATTALETSAKGNTYTVGAGSADQRVSFTQNVANGVMKLTGDKPYHLGQTHTGTASTVDFESVTLYATDPNPEAHGFGVGQGTYTFSGNTTLEAAKFVLSQGGAGRTSVFTMKDTSSVKVTGESNVDSNQSTIMFGHWAGPSTFTIKDNATFTAENAQILMGKTGDTQIINVEGGTMTVKGIKNSAGAGTSTINLKGGTLKLGDVGIDTYAANKTITVNAESDTIIETTADVVPVTQNITGTGYITKKGSGTLKLANTNHGSFGAIEAGKIQIVAKANEIADGEIQIPTSQTSYAEGAIEVVNAQGENILDSAAIESGVLKLVLLSQSIKATSNVSDWNSEWTGAVSVKNDDPENAMTMTVNAAFPAGVTTVNIFGKVDIVYTEGASADQSVTIAPQSGAAVSVTGAIANTITVPSGVTLDITGAVKKPFTIVNGSVVNLKDGSSVEADITATAGTLNVEGNVTASAQILTGGTLTIKEGAVLTSTNNQPFGPNRRGGTYNIYGTLDIGSGTFTHNFGATFNIYSGAIIRGTGAFTRGGGSNTTYQLRKNANASTDYVTFDVPMKWEYADYGDVYNFESGVGVKFLKAGTRNATHTLQGSNISGVEIQYGTFKKSANGKSLRGDIVIGANTKLILDTVDDIVSYDTAPIAAFDIAGTLQCDRRQTIAANGNAASVTLRNGGSITGNGTANGQSFTCGLDVYNAFTITVDGAATIATPISITGVDQVITIAKTAEAEAATLTLSGGLTGQTTGKIKLTEGTSLVAADLAEGKVITEVTGKKVVGDGSAETPYTLGAQTFMFTLNPLDDNRVKTQYKIGADGEWTDYTAPVEVEYDDSIYFQYVTVDSTKWTVNYAVTGLYYTHVKNGATYTPDVSKLTVTENTITFTVGAAPANAIRVVAVDGVEIEVADNAFTANVGASVVVTYKPADGYIGNTVNIPFTVANPMQTTEITAPTDMNIQKVVAVAYKQLVPTPISVECASLDAAIAVEGAIAVMLTDDINIAEPIVVEKSSLIDLDGHTITTSSRAFVVQGEGVTLSIGNGSIVGPTGATAAALDGKAIITVDGARLEFSDGTLTCGGSGSDGMYGVYVLNGGTAIFGYVDEGVAYGPTISSHFAAIGTNNTTAPATITIHGGEYTAAANTTTERWSYFCAAIYAPSAGSYTINGGTFNGQYAISSRYSNVNQTIAINGGSLNGSVVDIFVDEVIGTAAEDPVRTITIATGVEATIPEGYSWVDGTLTKDSEGPKSWDDVTTDTKAEDVVPETIKETIAASNVKATDIKTWATTHNVDIAHGDISVNALIFNTTPAAVQAETFVAADAAAEVLKEVIEAEKVDLAALLAKAVAEGEGGLTITSLSTEYPMATIKLVPSKKLESTGTAKFFQLSIELK